MHQRLFPPRQRSVPIHRFSEEVETAIRDNWVTSSSSDESSGSDTNTGTKPAQYFQPRKPIFKALRKSPSLEQNTKRTTAQSNITHSVGTSNKHHSQGAIYAQRHRKDDKDHAPNGVSSGSNRPATPRPPLRNKSLDVELRASPPTASLSGLAMQIKPRNVIDLTAYEAFESPITPARNHEKPITVLGRVDKQLAQSQIGVEESSRSIYSPTGGNLVKANSKLKLRTPKSASLQPTPVSSSKKRRRSIYELEDDEEIEDSDNEGEVESALVSRTPSPTRGRISVYLPRI